MARIERETGDLLSDGGEREEGGRREGGLSPPTHLLTTIYFQSFFPLCRLTSNLIGCPSEHRRGPRVTS